MTLIERKTALLIGPDSDGSPGWLTDIFFDLINPSNFS